MTAEEYLFAKKKWDALEANLRIMREDYILVSGMPAALKAKMLVEFDEKYDALPLVKKYAPDFLLRDSYRPPMAMPTYEEMRAASVSMPATPATPMGHVIVEQEYEVIPPPLPRKNKMFNGNVFLLVVTILLGVLFIVWAIAKG